MLRRRQNRALMWAAAAAFAAAASLSWWRAFDEGAGLRDAVPALGLTAAAVIWLANVMVARRAAGAAEGDSL